MRTPPSLSKPITRGISPVSCLTGAVLSTIARVVTVSRAIPRVTAPSPGP